MDDLLTEPQRQFKSRFEAFCEDRIAPHAREADRTGKLPEENWNALVEEGFFALFHPKSLGGSNADGVTIGIAMEALGKACASTLWTTTISTAVCGKLLCALAGRDHNERWVQPLLRGEKIGCIAGAEDHAASDQRPKCFQTAIRKSGDGYRLNGHKFVISNGSIADVGLVLGRLEGASSQDGGLAFAVVDLRLPGVTATPVSPLMGMRAMPCGGFEFDDVKLSDSDVIFGVAPDDIARAVEWGQLMQCFCSIGLAREALEVSIAFSQKHVAYERPIAHLPTIHGRLADMYMEIDAARLLGMNAATVMAQNRMAGPLVQTAKIKATEMGVQVADAAMRIFAGRGYSTDFVIERIYRDAIGNVPPGLTPDRLRELMMCKEFGVNPWQYDPFDWLAPAGLTLS